MVGPKCSKNRSHIFVTLLAIHRKLPTIVLAKTFFMKLGPMF